MSCAGQAFILYATIPGAVPGIVAVDLSIDGGSTALISQPTNSSDVFMDPLFTSSIMEFTNHTVVVTNRGNISFMFDEVELFSNDVIPSMSDPPSISNTSTTNSPSSSSQPTSISSRSKHHTGAIVGGVVGGLAFIILSLLAFLFIWRRSRYRNSQSHKEDKNSKPYWSFFIPECYADVVKAGKPLAAKPFPLSTSQTSQNHPYPIDSNRPFASAEKDVLRAQSSNEERLGDPPALSTPDHSTSASDYPSIVRASTSDLNSSQPSNTTNDIAVEMFGHSETVTTSTGSVYAADSFSRPGGDGPPPYQPLSASRKEGFGHQIRSPIKEESEPGTF